MSLKMKLNLVNKHEYEENEDYREIVIKIPKESEKFERDLKYLGLEYNNLSIQDTHILHCEVIDTDDPEFSKDISRRISDIIEVGSEKGYTTPYQDVKQMFSTINGLDREDKEKLLAVLEMKREEILNINDAVKYAKHLDNFTIYSDIEVPEDYARRIIEDGEVSIYDIIDYIDLFALGKDYCDGNGGKQTDYGLIIETESFSYDKQSIKQNEDEDELE